MRGPQGAEFGSGLINVAILLRWYFKEACTDCDLDGTITPIPQLGKFTCDLELGISVSAFCKPL